MNRIRTRRQVKRDAIFDRILTGAAILASAWLGLIVTALRILELMTVGEYIPMIALSALGVMLAGYCKDEIDEETRTRLDEFDV